MIKTILALLLISSSAFADCQSYFSKGAFEYNDGISQYEQGFGYFDLAKEEAQKPNPNIAKFCDYLFLSSSHIFQGSLKFGSCFESFSLAKNACVGGQKITASKYKNSCKDNNEVSASNFNSVYKQFKDNCYDSRSVVELNELEDLNELLTI